MVITYLAGDNYLVVTYPPSKFYVVSSLQREIDRTIESNFADIRVRNETITLDMVRHTFYCTITKIPLYYQITSCSADGLST